MYLRTKVLKTLRAYLAAVFLVFRRALRAVLRAPLRAPLRAVFLADFLRAAIINSLLAVVGCKPLCLPPTSSV
jgi:hypothetical protein